MNRPSPDFDSCRQAPRAPRFGINIPSCCTCWLSVRQNPTVVGRSLGLCMFFRIRKVLAILEYAARSPRRFVHDAYEALLDHEFLEKCNVPNLPAAFITELASGDIKLPSTSSLIDGTQDLPGLAFLSSLARRLGARSVFEIGTFTGLTALTIAMNCPEAVVHTLDLPATAQPALTIDPGDANYLTSAARIRVFEGRQEAARIIQHEGDSAQFDYSALNEQFDLVYIDGSHSYEYVVKDSQAAFSIVSSRGAIVWDDYSRTWPDIVRYLNERVDLKLYRVPETRLVAWFADQCPVSTSVLGP
jgi:Methyltransferase domain